MVIGKINHVGIGEMDKWGEGEGKKGKEREIL